MSEIVKIYANKAALVDYKQPNSSFSVGSSCALSGFLYLLTGFAAVPENYKQKEILAYDIYFCTSSTDVSHFEVSAILNEWEEGSATYNSSRPNGTLDLRLELSERSGWLKTRYTGTMPLSSILGNGVSLYYSWAQSSATVYTAKSSNQPYLQLELGEAITFDISRTGTYSSYVDLKQAAQFSWEYEPSTINFIGEAPTVTAANFVWWISGSSTLNTVPADIASSKVVIPANTFPENNIEWQIQLVDDRGITSTSPTYSFTTIEPLSTAVPLFPINGAYVNENEPITFTWDHIISTNSAQTAVEIVWDMGDQLSSYTYDISSESLTLPAGTFPNGEIKWKVRTYNSNGKAGFQSDYATFTTIDATSTAKSVSPINTIEDGSKPIKLSWEHIISTGTAQTRAEVQYGVTDGSRTTVTVQGTANSYEIPADTLTAGTNWWWVRTYNSDGVAGEWSSGASFICIASPATPAVSVQASPMPVISWQAAGQQAYRVIVGEYDSGPRFGISKSFRLPEILEDGEYTAQVMVQNQYGLWSEPGVIPFTVLNDVPHNRMDFKAEATAYTVRLSWNKWDFVETRIYRNGKLIAVTSKDHFDDIYAVGQLSYYVIGVADDGNYTRTEPVSCRVCLNSSIICDVNTGEWLELRLSERSNSLQSFSNQRSGTVRHYLGSRYPSLELSEFYDRSGAYDVAFSDLNQAKAFQALLGKIVCIKSRGDKVLVGGLLSLSEAVSDFYISYSFSIQQIDWQEVIYDTDS